MSCPRRPGLTLAVSDFYLYSFFISSPASDTILCYNPLKNSGLNIMLPLIADSRVFNSFILSVTHIYYYQMKKDIKLQVSSLLSLKVKV